MNLTAKKRISALIVTLVISSVAVSNTHASQVISASEARYKVTPISTSKSGKTTITISLPDDKEEERIEKGNVSVGDGLKVTNFTPKGGGVYVIEVEGAKKDGTTPIDLKLTKDGVDYKSMNNNPIVAPKPTPKAPKVNVAQSYIVSTPKAPAQEAPTKEAENTSASSPAKEAVLSSRLVEQKTAAAPEQTAKTSEEANAVGKSQTVLPKAEEKKEVPVASANKDNKASAVDSKENAKDGKKADVAIEKPTQANNNDSVTKDTSGSAQEAAPATSLAAPEKAEVTVFTIGKNTYSTTAGGTKSVKEFEIAPRIHQGKTVLPARAISELLGLTVSYDNASRTASFHYGDSAKVELQLDQNYMLVNGEKVELTGEILIVNERILLPIRDIQTALTKLGLKSEITWNQADQSITIEKTVK